MSEAEIKAIDTRLAFDRAHKMVVAEDALDISLMATGAGVKLNGRDAQGRLFLHGGGEVLIRHLNLNLVTAHIENNQEVDRLVHKMKTNEVFIANEKVQKNEVVKKMLDLQNDTVQAVDIGCDLLRMYCLEDGTTVPLDQKSDKVMQKSHTRCRW